MKLYFLKSSNAEKYGKIPAQIILKWHNQMGFIVIPGSRNPEHIKENADIFDFKLTDDEMAEIAKLDKGIRYYNGACILMGIFMLFLC